MGYKISKDYEAIYERVQTEDIVCFVDYSFSKHFPAVRDICLCRKHKPGHITFSARGIEYGEVDDYFVNENRTYKDVFVLICKSLNLEWIVPEWEG